jgi:hypothetical protein
MESHSLDFKDVESLCRLHGNYYKLSESQRSQMKKFEEEVLANKQLSDDPRHPMYYIVYSNSLPHEQAYRMIDSRKDIKVPQNKKDTQSKKTYKRRYLYDGWNNWTDFEKESVEKVKQMLLEKKGIDVSLKKDYGPRTQDGFVKQGSS